MPKRSYNRRSDEQIIGDLQAKISKLEARIEAKKRGDSPVLKEIPKLRRTLGRFAQLCMDSQREDLSNTVLAFLTTLETQARQKHEGPRGARHHEPQPRHQELEV